MDSSYALALLKNTELGLAFQKSEQKAADHLSHKPHHFADRNAAQRGEVIYPGDPQGNPQPPAPASKLGTASVSIAKLFVLSAPCFDRESTPYQFPNLADSLGAGSNAIFSSKLPCTFSTQSLLLLFQCPSPPRGLRIFCLCTRVISAHLYQTLALTGTPISSVWLRNVRTDFSHPSCTPRAMPAVSGS